MLRKILFSAVLMLGLLVFAPASHNLTYLPSVWAAESQTVSASTLLNAASVVIYQRAGVPAGSEDLTIAQLGSPGDAAVPAGNLELAVDLPYGVRYNAPTTANVTIKVDGTVAAVQTLKFQVKLFHQVVVAARPIMRGEVFSEENLRLERMDVSRMNLGYYTDSTQLIGLLSHRAINPGMALNKYMIERPILVKRGSAVMIIAKIGGIEVSTAGKAMQDGYGDQIIRVQNINSHKYMNAKVVDSSTVEVITYTP